MKSLQKTAIGFALLCVSGIASAQNIAVVNGKPIPRARADAFVAELVKQGQQDTPQLQALVRQELVDREILVQEAERRGLSAKPDVRFQLDNVRQQVLINALVQDQLTKGGVSDAEVKADTLKFMRSRTLFILFTLISFLFSTQTPAIADNPPRRILSGWLPDYSLSRNLPTVEGNLDLIRDISPFWYGLTGETSIKDKYALGRYTTPKDAVIARLKANGLILLPTIAKELSAIDRWQAIWQFQASYLSF